MFNIQDYVHEEVDESIDGIVVFYYCENCDGAGDKVETVVHDEGCLIGEILRLQKALAHEKKDAEDFLHSLAQRDQDVVGLERIAKSYGWDGLGLCPKCHGAETPYGSLCRVCAEEKLADSG